MLADILPQNDNFLFFNEHVPFFPTDVLLRQYFYVCVCVFVSVI